MRSAALVNVATGQPDSAIRISVQAAKIGAFIDDNGGNMDIVINVSELKMVEIIDALRAQQVGTVYLQDLSKISLYPGKAITLLTVLEELDIEILSLADGGRVSNDSMTKLADKLTEQIMRDAQIG